jgi:hypothetical protein
MPVILDNTISAVRANTVFFAGDPGSPGLSAEAVAGSTTVTLPQANGALLVGAESHLLYLQPAITPTQLAADTDGWAPTGYVTAKVIRANNGDSWYLGGLTKGVPDCVTLINVGANTLLLNHESNTSGAASRFNLSEDQVVLSSNTKAILIYDLVLSRWFVNGGERKVGKGFFSGGTTGAVSAVADRTTYATEVTAAVSGANLSLARREPGAAGNALKGFFAGGNSGAVSAVADRTTYATEVTVAVSGANLSVARDAPGAAGNALKGFFSGGSTGTDSVVADRTTYATEVTAAVSGANLTVARDSLGAVGNASKGFFSGGATSVEVATADRTTYATEVTAAVSGANLSLARQGPGACGNALKGFFLGGYINGPNTNVADRTTYATEVTAAVSGANLSVARDTPGAAGNASKGFFSGGDSTSLSLVADRTTWATEVTLAVSGANLSLARFAPGAAGTGIF